MNDWTLIIDKIGSYSSVQMVTVHFHFENDQGDRDAFQIEKFWVTDDTFFDNKPTLEEYIAGELKDRTYD